MATSPTPQNNALPGHGLIRLVHRSIPATVDSPAGILTLPLPEDISFGISSSWEAFSEGNLIDFINKGAKYVPAVGEPGAFAYETYARATNRNAYISSFSHQMWRGTSPLEFRLKVTLTAYENAKKEIMDKLEILTRLSIPQGNRELTPGEQGIAENLALSAVKQFDPNASLITAPPRDIGLHLGSNLRIPAVVIPDISMSFENRVDVEGNFIYATVDLSIKSSYTPNSGMFVFKSFQSSEEVLNS
jgi:hypothetical protein